MQRGSSPFSSLEGQLVGNFRVERLLGKGGMGEVYLAVHPEIGRQVAIKLMDARWAASKASLRRFRTEARAIARLAHPNVVQIFDYGQLEDGRLYYIMEFLDGRSLFEVLRETGPMAPDEVVPYLAQIGAAVQAAHDLGIIHRDLKPENIIVVEQDPLQLKVLDLGLVKVLQATHEAERTATGAVLGTPEFMAPEQAAGLQDRIGPQTDIYSLGILLYLMLAGRLPFAEAPPLVMAAKQVHAPPDPLGEAAPWLRDARVVPLVESCLAKNPSARPACVTALVTGFEVLAGEPWEAPLRDTWVCAVPPRRHGSVTLPPDPDLARTQERTVVIPPSQRARWRASIQRLAAHRRALAWIGVFLLGATTATVALLSAGRRDAVTPSPPAAGTLRRDAGLASKQLDARAATARTPDEGLPPALSYVPADAADTARPAADAGAVRRAATAPRRGRAPQRRPRSRPRQRPPETQPYKIGDRTLNPFKVLDPFRP